jgi:chlorobactene glucosyltransferase
MIAATPTVTAPLAAHLFGRGLSLSRFTPPPPHDSPLVSVIIPARNEAHRIEKCVRSILASRYPAFELIVVDDRSTDGTHRILAAMARDDARLTVIEGDELPAGWFGKPWACFQGARVAKGGILLFTDADTWHGPDLLGRAVTMLRTSGVDMVTLLQRQEMKTFWERVTQPHLFALIGVPAVLAVGGDPDRLNERQSPRTAVANGQFIMVTRESYDAIGGHGAVKGEVVEDVMLARRYAEGGRKRWIATAMDDMSTRMYWSLGEIVEGWSKNLFMGGQILWGRIGGYAGILLVFLIVLLGFLPVAALAWGAVTGVPAVIAFGAVGFAMGALATAMFLRANREPAWYGLFFWAGQLVLMWILLRSTARGRRRIEWKGRRYQHA